ncbi:MAG: cobalamin B12-binding domain-containing protein [Planctomycetota bacterium]
MNKEITVERLFEVLIRGDRAAANELIRETRAAKMSPEELAHDVYWSVLEMLNTLYRADQLATLAHHYATRLLRRLVDQAQAEYEQKPRRQRKILMFCGRADADELEAQLVADLAEADGYEVYFGGAGIANDEILAEIGVQRPDLLLFFASGPSDAPNIRQLIDTIRKIDACPNIQIVVGGGVFNRAEGLAEEIGADLWAKTPRELLEKLVSMKERRATTDQRTVGRNRRGNKSAVA